MDEELGDGAAAGHTQELMTIGAQAVLDQGVKTPYANAWCLASSLRIMAQIDSGPHRGGAREERQ